ncbi:MAG: PAS domain-containing protein, partial [Desulfobulbaceae bacterium]|nr:PAS domain-containing protein [Desulfobulbaceae bacterium]
MGRDDVPLFRALQGEVVRNVEMMVIPADQTRARVLVANGQPLISSDGTLLGAVATMHDITERKEVEQSLATSEAFRRAIIDSSHDCIQVLDLAGNLLFMNLGGQRLMEIEDVERYLHKSWPELYQGPDREVALAACEQARQGRVGTFQSACATAKGKPKWWDVVITPMVDSEGRVQRLLAISRDITESHLHQQEWQDAMAFFADGIV